MKGSSPLIKNPIRMNRPSATGIVRHAICNWHWEMPMKDVPIGIEQLLSDYDKTISLVPTLNERLERRE